MTIHPFLILLSSMALVSVGCSYKPTSAAHTKVDSGIESNKISAKDAQYLHSIIDAKDEIAAGASKEDKIRYLMNMQFEGKNRLFAVLSKTKSYSSLIEEIRSIPNASIVVSDEKTGYVSFRADARNAVKILDSKHVSLFMVDKSLRETFDVPNAEPGDVAVSPAAPKNLYPIHVMKADELVARLKAERNVTVDGSTVTVAVMDTGLDMSRTDVFQDRIVGLRTVRSSDRAILTDATTIEENGKKYLVADIKGIPVKIERSERLAADRKYYVGFISEKLSKNGYSEDGFLDLNLDEEGNGFFPVVLFKNEAGEFVAYINVNSAETYGAKGDMSIEDENMLMDFSAARATKADYYVRNTRDESKSYYKYTTRMDIVGEADDSDEKVILSDRNKGRMNLALNIEPEFEINKDTGELNELKLSGDDTQKFYFVSFAGYDNGEHGTHCAGSAVGKFTKAPQFNAPAYNAKLVGIPMLGGSASSIWFANSLFQTVKRYPNVVFSFSWGSTSELNEANTSEGKLFNEIARKYHTAFIKSAGNSGPGLKSAGPTAPSMTLNIASMYNTDARLLLHPSHGAFKPGRNYVSYYSSRGPMIDGSLKPDISGPGWVLSSTPLAGTAAYQTWTGTSMAAPNVASAVALLYDAANKTGLAKVENNISSLSIDKIHVAVKNSALPYNDYVSTTCTYNGMLTTTPQGCELKKKENKYLWTDGGAGLINAAAAYSVLEKIANDPEAFYVSETKSYIPGYNQPAAGHLAYDRIEREIKLIIRLDNPATVEGMTDTRTLTLRIPDDVDWLSFHPNEDQKELRDVLVSSSPSGDVILYVHPETIVDGTGHLKPGIHQAIIKGYEANRPEFFAYTFPVTIVGATTRFDSILSGSGQFAAEGFVEADQYARYFIPVATKDAITVLDFDVSNTRPGQVGIQVYKNGVEIEAKMMGATERSIMTNTHDGVEGINHVRYVLQDMPEGLYEVNVTSKPRAPYSFEGTPGSFFSMKAYQQLITGDASMTKSGDAAMVSLSDMRNRGSAFRVDGARVVASKLLHEEDIVVKDQDSTMIPIIVADGMNALDIATSYAGAYMDDIDITLVDMSTMSAIGQSAGGDCNERIVAKVKPGMYALKVDGYKVDGPAKEDTFKVSIAQQMASPLVLVSDFDLGTSKLQKGFVWANGAEYSMRANIPAAALSRVPKIDGYSAVIQAEIRSVAGGNGESIPVFRREMK